MSSLEICGDTPLCLELHCNSCLNGPASSCCFEYPGVLCVLFFLWLTIFRRNKALVKELSKPPPGSSDLYFPTQYSRSTFDQFKCCLWKQWLTYWRSPDYNLVRMFFALFTALLLGIVFWRVGRKMYVLTMLSCQLLLYMSFILSQMCITGSLTVCYWVQKEFNRSFDHHWINVFCCCICWF